MRIPNSLCAALAALVLSAAPAAAQGTWRVSYPEVQDPMHQFMQQMFVAQDPLAAMVEPLNEFFPVPRDVTLEIAECGRPGAFYDAERPAVQLCYELMVQLAEELMSGDDEDGEEAFAGAFAIVLLHQVGHAMIDQLELPVSAGPEEAADQLVAVMVGYADGELASTVQGALTLNELEIDWENPGSGRPALRGQRLQNLVCLLYGADPDAHEWVLEEDVLDEQRASACEERFGEVEQEWIQMLSGDAEG